MPQFSKLNRIHTLTCFLLKTLIVEVFSDICIQIQTHDATDTDIVQLIVLLLSHRNDDGWRPGDGERTPLSALPSSQLFGHSLQRDQTGPNRHEHSFHPAQC